MSPDKIDIELSKLLFWGKAELEDERKLTRFGLKHGGRKMSDILSAIALLATIIFMVASWPTLSSPDVSSATKEQLIKALIAFALFSQLGMFALYYKLRYVVGVILLLAIFAGGPIAILSRL